MDKWLKRISKSKPPQADYVQSDEKIEGVIADDKSDTEPELLAPSTSSHETKRRKVVRKYDIEYLKTSIHVEPRHNGSTSSMRNLLRTISE